MPEKPEDNNHIKKGIGKLHNAQSGKSLYLPKKLADEIDLPLSDDLLVIWDDTKKTLTVQRW